MHLNDDFGKEELPMRFNTWEFPWQFNRFDWGVRRDRSFEGEPATAVARQFGMDETTIRRALALSQDPPWLEA